MSRSLFEYRLEKRFHQRIYIFTGLIFSVALVLCFQLGNLQLVQGFDNMVLARKFVNRQEFTVAPRGLMYDRNYAPGATPLVDNIRFIDYVIYPTRFPDRDTAVAYVRRFSGVMGRPFEEFADDLTEENWSQLRRRNGAITLMTRMTRREQERLAEFHISDSYGEFVPNHLRYYSMGPAMAHVSGYIGLPSRRDLDRGLARSYQTLGKAGLEAQYDQDLRGRDGVRIRHRIINQEEQVTHTEQGDSLVLTIDRDVQTAAYQALVNSGRRGTAIAIRAATGEILALVSNPTFDPNILSSGTAHQREEHLAQISRHDGFLNLAIQGKSPPASTFKPLVALAALERAPQRDINMHTSFTCHGSYVLQSTRPGVPDARYACWNAGHGTNDMIGAIAQSCNVYFYNLGYHIGSRPIIYFARAFGLERPTGIDLPGEIHGLVPDERWKQLNWASKWYDGDTLNLAIGQGFLQTTPMEIAFLFSALANRGKLIQPHLVREVRDPEGHVVRRIAPAIDQVAVSQSNLAVVQRGMRAVVTRGTTRRLAAIPVPIAGKTGTAQTRSNRQSRNHAWFAGFAPFGAAPEDIVVVVVWIEYGQGGAAAAAPVAGEIFQAAFPNWTQRDTLALEQPPGGFENISEQALPGPARVEQPDDQ